MIVLCLLLCALLAQILVDPDDYCLAVPCQFVCVVDLGCSKGHTCQGLFYVYYYGHGWPRSLWILMVIVSLFSRV